MTLREIVLIFLIGGLMGLFVGVEVKGYLTDRFWQEEFREMRITMTKSFDRVIPNWPEGPTVLAVEEERKGKRKGQP